jgi:lysophospholipase L1-like esterase
MKKSNYLLVALSICLLLIVFEASLRFLHYLTHNKLVEKYDNQDLCTEKSENSLLIYTFKPNKCNANSQGFIDYEYSYEKPKGTFRIVVIGDSVAQGAGVDLKETFAKVLENKLNKINKAEVIILARTGYSTSQELVLLKDNAFNYNPDLIIWSYVLNDPADPVYHNANGELGRYYYEPNVHIQSFLSTRFLSLEEKIKSFWCGKEFHKLIHCAHWGQIEKNIKQIGHVSKNKKIPIIFLIHPIFENIKNYNDYSLTKIHEKLSYLAVKEGLIVFDLLNAYKKYEIKDIKLASNADWYDPWHPNATGHQIAGEYIFQKLLEQKLIVQ